MISKIKAFFSSKDTASVSAVKIYDIPVDDQVIENVDSAINNNDEVQSDNTINECKERSRLRHLGYI